MKVIEFKQCHKQAFIDMNTAWIKENFGFLEKGDIDTFEHIEEELKNGAMIYVAEEESNAVMAVCMTKQMDQNTWEICKLAANENYRGRGAGSGVLKACMDYAIKKGASRLFIVSSRKLRPALQLYKKFGFQEVKQKSYGYQRGDIALEHLVSDKYGQKHSH